MYDNINNKRSNTTESSFTFFKDKKNNPKKLRKLNLNHIDCSLILKQNLVFFFQNLCKLILFHGSVLFLLQAVTYLSRNRKRIVSLYTCFFLSLFFLFHLPRFSFSFFFLSFFAPFARLSRTQRYSGWVAPSPELSWAGSNGGPGPLSRGKTRRGREEGKYRDLEKSV